MNAQGIGLTLRHERERKRVSLETIARATLVRRDYLELIDDGDLARLPRGAYAKGFIRSYASYLGLDPKPFVRAYEQGIEQPAPELSEFVRDPVRVPSAAQPRAWRIGVAAACATLAVLGLLGVFRHGEPTVPAPKMTSAAAAAGLALPAPNPLGAVVEVEITGDASWVEAVADGQTIFARTLERGEKKTFKGDRNVQIILGQAGNVRLTINGEDVGTPSAGAYRATYTPGSRTLLPSEIGSDGASSPSGDAVR